jgi:hypothetical protein
VRLEPFKNWGTDWGTIPVKVGYNPNLRVEVTNGSNGYAVRGTKPGRKPFKVYDRDGLFFPGDRSCGAGATVSTAKKSSWRWASIRL